MKINIIFFIISRSFLHKMRNVSDKFCRENQSKHFVFNNFILENRDVHEIMWKNIVERCRPQITIWRMRIASWIPKATNTFRLCNTHCFSTAITLPPGYVIGTLPVISYNLFACHIISYNLFP